jgi:hypothetical protein
LYLAQPDVPVETLDGWGENYVYYVMDWPAYLIPVQRTEVLGRTPVILLAVLLGALLFRWGKEMGDAKIGLVALLAFIFDPLSLAHSRLATNDLGVTALGAFALYGAWKWVKRPTWRRAWLLGGLLGLTALAKASGVLWVLAFALMALLLFVRAPTQKARTNIVTQAGAAMLFAFLLVWAAYGFTFGRLEGLPVPVPAPEHWGQLLRHQDVPTRRVFWALGQMWEGRQWWYYPLNFLIRNPLPLLIGLTLSSVVLLRGRIRLFSGVELSDKLVAVFPILYTAAAITRGTSVGYRHMLPVHPFLYLFLALGLWHWLRRGLRWRLGVVGVLGAWYVIETLCLFPNEITYFNQLVGGPEQGYRYLVDYTQDWGQSFKQLQTWVADHPGPEPGVAYYTHIHPGYYGMVFRPIPPAPEAEPLSSPLHPSPGRYAIGVTPLQGVVGPDRMELEWFRHKQPTAKVGEALFVYDVAPFDGGWIAQCDVPVTPLPQEAIETGLDNPNIRQLSFDCQQSWVYPTGIQQSGWYAFHDQLFASNGLRQRLLYDPPQARDPFVARRLDDLRFAYQQEKPGLLPPFVFYETQDPISLPPLDQVWTAPAETPPSDLTSTESWKRTISLNGPLEFLGVQIFRQGESLELESWWRVKDGPVTRPGSLMAHLVDPAGQTLVVADGLGVSPLEWRAGDLLVQRHVFSPSSVDKELWLRLGAYWLDDGERWKLAEAPERDAIFIPLSP